MTTHWSAVWAAAHSEAAGAGNALAVLCERYWYPLYFYVRRRGYSAVDAQDLTQEFFARILAGHWLAQADPQRGRFRSFLLTSMKHFLANEWKREGAQKRGGHVTLVSLNECAAERRYLHDPATTDTPERLYERRWVCALLTEVMARLQGEYEQKGKGDLFSALKSTLTANSASLSYSALAAKFETSEAVMRMAVHRLRSRYRHLLRAEVANTVSSPEEVTEEMHYLFRVLTGE